MKWIYDMNNRLLELKAIPVIFRAQCQFRKLVNIQTLGFAINNIDSQYYIIHFFDAFYYLLEMYYMLYHRKHHSTLNLRALYENIK